MPNVGGNAKKETMRTILSILICFSAATMMSAQTYDYPVFDLTGLLKENKTKTYDLWVCMDSSCIKRSKSTEIVFKSGQIIKESLFDNEDKVFQLFLYKYDSKNRLIQKDFKCDAGYWIYYKYSYNKDGQIANQIITAKDNIYNVNIEYKYVDSLLINKEYTESGKDRLNEGEGKDIYEYNNLKRLVSIKNFQTSYITRFEYDSIGNLIFSIKQFIDKPDWEQDINKYFYNKSKLIKQIHEWYNSGEKDRIHTENLSFEYYPNGLLKNIIKESSGERIYEFVTYE
jgi:hypothetical protein